jgi:hypothetical protein
MLPGFSSKNNKTINYIGGKKKIKSKKHHGYGDYESNDDKFNEIMVQYSLEKMSEEDVSHCDNVNRDTYPFASSLSKNIDDESLFYENIGVESESESEGEDPYGNNKTKISICTYQINTSCKLPFIEYLMTMSDEKESKIVFEFPKFEYTETRRKDVVKQAEEVVLKILKKCNNCNSEEEEEEDEVIKFRGIFKPKHSGSSGIYLFFQKYFKKSKHPCQLSKRDRVWWIVASEIANFKRVMYMKIDPPIHNLFIKNPEMMHLYDRQGRLLETPTVCYFGDEFQKIKYLAFFGLLKAPVKSSFGPFYVATNFLSSMKYACYTHNQEPFELYDGEKITTGDHGKYKEGGVLRMVLFVGKMKVFLRDGEPDESQISQELAKTDKTVEKFLSLRDSNGNWTEEYDTAYKGLHFASMKDGDRSDVAVNPVEWFFKDYNHSVVVSYHNIDTANIPMKFDVDYADYKLK